MPIALDVSNVGEFQQTVAANTMSLTTGTTTAPNSTIVVGIVARDGCTGIASPSGGGLTWTLAGSLNKAAELAVGLIYAYAPAGLASGSVISVNLSGGGTYTGDIVASSYVGVAPQSVAGVTAQASASGAWTVSLSSTGEMLLIAANATWDGTLTSTPTAPSVEEHDFHALILERRIETVSGTYTVAGTMSGSASDWITVGVALAAPQGQVVRPSLPFMSNGRI